MCVYIIVKVSVCVQYIESVCECVVCVCVFACVRECMRLSVCVRLYFIEERDVHLYIDKEM